MPAINWRERFIAASIHFLFTALVAGLAAVLVFFVWFPNNLSALIGGGALFLIMVGCDVVLGPLLSLVIYSSAKPKRELILDYTVVAVLQLGALGYGLWSMAESRPVFLAFDVRRIEIVAALELDDADLAQGVEQKFRERALTGPRLVSMQRPTDAKERSDLLFAEIEGRGAYLSPKYYRDYDAAIGAIKENELALESLLNGSGTAEPIIRDAIAKSGKQATELKWMLVHHRFGFGVALIDATTHRPVRFVPVNPRWWLAQ